MITAQVVEDSQGFYIEIAVGGSYVFYGRYSTKQEANAALRALKLRKLYY